MRRLTLFCVAVLLLIAPIANAANIGFTPLWRLPSLPAPAYVFEPARLLMGAVPEINFNLLPTPTFKIKGIVPAPGQADQKIFPVAGFVDTASASVYIASGTNQLHLVSGNWPAWAQGATICVPGADQSYTNGAATWAGSTSYVLGDTVTWNGLVLTPFRANSDATFTLSNWMSVMGGATATDLETTIVSVSGSVATLAKNASTTVTSGAPSTCWYGLEDSASWTAAIQAAHAAGGGEVFVPYTGTGTYQIQNVDVLSGVSVVIADNVVVRPSMPLGDRPLLMFRNADGSLSTGCSVTGKHWVADFTGVQAERYSAGTWTRKGGIGAAYIDAAANYEIGGCTGLNLPAGNVVGVAPTATNVNPTDGNIHDLDNIASSGFGEVGFGTLQGDGLTRAKLSNVSSHVIGRAANFEADDSGSFVRTISGVVGYNINQVGSGAPINQEAVAFVAHSNQISDIHIYGVTATGGGCGAFFSYIPVSPGVTPTPGTNGGSISNVSIDGMHVSGGGTGTNVSTNCYFTNVSISNSVVENSNTTNLSNSTPYAGFIYSSGMTFTNCQALNCYNTGFQSAFFDGSIQPFAPGAASFDHCNSYNNGSMGLTTYGFQNNYVARVNLVSCNAKDAVDINTMPLTLLDNQTATNTTGYWVSSTGAPVLTRDVNTGWKMALDLAAPSGTPTLLVTHSLRTTSPTSEMQTAIPGLWYGGYMAARPMGNLADTNQHNCQVSGNWFDSSGASISSWVGGQSVATHAGRFVPLRVLSRAVSTAAWFEPSLSVSNGGGFPLGEKYQLVPLDWGPLSPQPGAASVLTATGGTTTTITTTTSPLFQGTTLHPLTGANTADEVITSVSGGGPYTVTVSPTMSFAPSNGDTWQSPSRQSYGLFLAQGTSASLVDCSLTPNANSVMNNQTRIQGAGTYTETCSRDPDGQSLAPAIVGQIHALDGVQGKDVNTTGLTSAQIDALFTLTPGDGTTLSDTTQNISLVRQNGLWGVSVGGGWWPVSAGTTAVATGAASVSATKGSGSQDWAGTVSGTGQTVGTTGAIFSLTFGTALTHSPSVLISPVGSSSQNCNWYLSAVGPTGFTVSARTTMDNTAAWSFGYRVTPLPN